FNGSDMKLLSPEPSDHLVPPLASDGPSAYPSISPTGRYVVYTAAPMDKAPQTYVRTTNDGRRVAALDAADATDVFAAGYRPPEELTLKAADGKSDVWAVLYKPRNFDPAKRYPIIDMQYGSPLVATVPHNLMEALSGVPGFGSPASLAQLGFLVIVVDARGTPYRSREFSQSEPGYLTTMGLEDHVAAIQQLAARYPYVDSERVGITGLSFSGWTTLRAMLQFGDFFKVG